MTKKEALAHFGGSMRKLAEALGLSTQAVHRWPQEKVPELRQYQIRDILAKRDA